jgi:hypothetical protein
VRPDPGNPSDPMNVAVTDNHWTIDGLPAAATRESEAKLNRVAFVQKVTFEAHLPTRTITNVHRMTASFKHCSVTTERQCQMDADPEEDCAEINETCVSTPLELTTSGSFADFTWFLGSQALSAGTYSTPQTWRGELCGDLDGPITVYWRGPSGEESAVVPPGADNRVLIHAQ